MSILNIYYMNLRSGNYLPVIYLMMKLDFYLRIIATINEWCYKREQIK